MEKPSCPKCESKNVYYRSGLKSFICRICGSIWNKKQEVTK